MTIWVVLSVGAIYNLWVDQAKACHSTQFKSLANMLAYNLIPIDVELHWSLIAERCHDPLRRIANELFTGHPHAPLSLIIDHANLAVSHTRSPEVFTTAILAFGTQLCLPVGNFYQQPQPVTNRMDLMSIKRTKYAAIVSALRVCKALRSATPKETVRDITSRKEVFIYHEKVGWDGPNTFFIPRSPIYNCS